MKMILPSNRLINLDLFTQITIDAPVAHTVTFSLSDGTTLTETFADYYSCEVFTEALIALLSPIDKRIAAPIVTDASAPNPCATAGGDTIILNGINLRSNFEIRINGVKANFPFYGGPQQVGGKTPPNPPGTYDVVYTDLDTHQTSTVFTTITYAAPVVPS